MRRIETKILDLERCVNILQLDILVLRAGNCITSSRITSVRNFHRQMDALNEMCGVSWIGYILA